MSEFLQRLESVVISRGLLPARKNILVAVSGGVDSMVLLHALARLAPQKRGKLHAVHFNHQLRGRASDADERLVRRTARTLKLPVTVGRGNVKGFALGHKVSLEMAARHLRHEFFARTARREHAPAIVLAHHADDQVELFFLRLLRGAGGEGLGGMKPRIPSFMDRKIALVRPLLDFSKSEILTFATANRISYRQDASNASNDFLRNRIRNELLPLLRDKYQPAVATTVLRLMEITGTESEFVSEAANQWLRRRRIGPGGFTRLPIAVQRKILQSQLAGSGAEFELVENLRVAPGKFVSLNPDLAVSRNAAGRLKFKCAESREFNTDQLAVILQGRAGGVDFADRTFRWRLERRAKRLPPPKQAGQEFFDADRVGDKIILRHWRAGDRFQPIGMKTASKLQDLFVNAKIPARRRRQLVLAATRDGTIFWVEVLRIGEPFKLTAHTRRQLVWHGCEAK